MEYNIIVESSDCIICCEYNDMIIFDCSHIICIVCYEKIINTNPLCPICRKPIDMKQPIQNNIITSTTTYSRKIFIMIALVIIVVVIIIKFFSPV
jgi:hypothetical protein